MTTTPRREKNKKRRNWGFGVRPNACNGGGRGLRRGGGGEEEMDRNGMITLEVEIRKEEEKK